jgi:hypothetical protein
MNTSQIPLLVAQKEDIFSSLRLPAGRVIFPP